MAEVGGSIQFEVLLERYAREFLEWTYYIARRVIDMSPRRIRKANLKKSRSDQTWFPAAPILTPDSLDDYGAPQAPVVGGGGGSVDDYGAPAAPVVGPQQPTYGSNDCQVTRSLVNTGSCEQGGQVRNPTWGVFTKRNLLMVYLLALLDFWRADGWNSATSIIRQNRNILHFSLNSRIAN